MIDSLITWIEWMVFIVCACSIGYLFFFSVASLWRKKIHLTPTDKKQRFLVVYPAYAEDRVIVSSVNTFLAQTYPRVLYELVVVSDHMWKETNDELEKLPIRIVYADYKDSSKAKALKLVMSLYRPTDFDSIVILDADNIVETDFLEQINCARYMGMRAIQTHRISKIRNSEIGQLDAMSEEINNSIFRAGHIATGLSSALIGSGMAFEYHWFYEHVNNLATAGEDKEIEAMLLYEKIRIHYLEDVYVYDEKVQKTENFKNQRRRWMAAQFVAFSNMSKSIKSAIKQGNIDYCDKTLQQALVPRIINLMLVLLFSCFITFHHLNHAYKWWALLLIFFLTMYIAIPKYMKTKKLLHAFMKLPILTLATILNMFKLKGASKIFIHTKHE